MLVDDSAEDGTMSGVAKKTPKQPTDDEPKRYPSRDKVRYVAIPLELHEALDKYAKDNSDEDNVKSISWAARVAIRRFLRSEGLLPPPPAD
jgi:predicted Zn-dependent protease